jgi:hypothetical protein
MDETQSAHLTAIEAPVVRDLVRTHLRELDAEAPGLLDKLYLTGSVALGDYRHGPSDVDFLAVTARPLEPDDLAVLGRVHAAMPAEPHYDGIYLDPGQFTAMPDREEAVPHVVGGAFQADAPCGELNPMVWLMLLRHGVAVRGPRPAALGLAVADERVRRYNLDNLRDYWAPLAEQISHAVAGLPEGEPAYPAVVVWAVLGPARLHYTLATRDVSTKSAAGRYAAEHFPDWADLVRRAMDWRDGKDVIFTTTDARSAAAMVDAVVSDAWHRWG